MDSDARPRRNGRLLIAAFVLALPLVAGMYFLLQPSEYQQQLAALRAQGHPTDITELGSYFPVPADSHDNTDLWMAAVKAVDLDGLNEKAAALPFLGTGTNPVADRQALWPELEAARDLLKSLEAEFQLLQNAVDAGGVARYPDDLVFGVVRSLTSNGTITLARLLTLRAYVHFYDGDDSAVLQHIRGILVISDSLSSNPSSPSYFVRAAIHARACQLAMEMLPQMDWTEQQLTDLQSWLQNADFRRDLIIALHGDLSFSLNTITGMSWVPYRESNSQLLLSAYQASIDGLSGSWKSAFAIQDELTQQFKAPATGLLGQLKRQLAAHSIPAIQLSVRAGASADARRRCAIAIIAAARFQKRHGHLPGSRQELTMDFFPGGMNG
jgi:hypothetical protein